MDSNDDPSMEQDPLAIPSEYSNDEPQQAPSEHHSANTTDAESNNSDKNSNISSVDNASSNNELFSEQNLIKPEQLSEQTNDNQASRENHQLLQQQQQYIQTDNNKPQTSQSYDNDNNLQQQAHHEQHKAFSHSIENLSKTSDKCTPNDIKIFPNLIDAHDQFDDGYETGVGDLLSGNKYKLPSLPPPSSSPYSSMSSSSMSTISTATPTPSANLINPQQQQSPSYMSASMPPHLNQYHQSPQTQQQQQQMQQNTQYPMHNQQNQFSYHHLFNRMQPQAVGGPKGEPMVPNDDPYRFVSDEELSNSMNGMPHSNSMQNSMHHSHHPHMTSGMAPGNYSGSPSPMPNGPSHLNHMSMSPQSGNAMNPMMQQYSEHHQMQHHSHHQMHPQQAPPQHQLTPQHMPNGLVGNGIAHNNNPVVMQESPKKRGRKKKQRDENGNPVEDRPPKERKKHDRFNGMTEEEVIKRTLPDHLQHNLDIVIVGINPGLFAAYKGHHYAGPGNHFWKCLYLSGLTPQQMSAEDDFRLLQYGIGFTNMVERPTKGSADLTRKEIKEGSLLLIEKLRKFQPKIAVFNGKLIFEVFSGKKDFCFGKQPETIEGTNTYMWVMPSSSARCAQLPRAADKVPFYAALKKFRDYLNGQVPEYDETEYVFNDPKYNNISSEAEMKAEPNVFGALEADPSLIDPSKKKRGRPKKIRGENGEEIITPRRPPPVNEFDDLDPSKKKRGRPKKSKENLAKNKRNSAANAAAATANSNTNNDNVPSGLPAMPPQIAQQQTPVQIPPQHQQIQQQTPMQLNSSLINNGNGRAYLPSMNSPSQQNYGANNGVHSNNMLNHHHMSHHSQQQHLQQAPSPMNLCYSNTPNDNQQGQQPQAQTYQPSPLQSSSFSHSDLSSEISAAISSEQMVNSPVPTSPSLAQSDFEAPASMPAEDRNSVDLNRFVPQPQSTPTMDQQQQMAQQQQTQSTVNQSHHSPLSAAQSPVGYSQLPHMSNNSNYNSYQQQRQTPNLQQQQQQNYAIHQQQQQSGHSQAHPHQVPNNVNKNLMQLNSGNDLYKDVATKSLSGLESLVDQIPSLNDQDAMMSNNSNSSNGSNGNNPNMLANTQTASINANDNASSLGIGGQASISSAPNDDQYNNCIFSGFPSSGSSNAPQPPSAATQSLVAPPMPPSHHPSHYPYHSANHPFSVNSLTSSANYSAAAAMNSYHQNLMNASHLPSSFMEPPHMPVPVTPALYHSYQQHQAAGYAGYHPAPGPPHTLHMPSPNYPQHYYSQSPPGYHSMFGGF